eukprot:scaffold7.g3448.t1
MAFAAWLSGSSSALPRVRVSRRGGPVGRLAGRRGAAPCAAAGGGAAGEAPQVEVFRSHIREQLSGGHPFLARHGPCGELDPAGRDWADLGELQERLGYVFLHPPLLRLALCHASLGGNPVAAATGDNKLLAWLGDGVLELVVRDAMLAAARSDVRRGVLNQHLDRRKSRAEAARCARTLGLADHLRTGNGMQGWVEDSMLAEALEAVLAAAFADGGYAAARDIYLCCFPITEQTV